MPKYKNLTPKLIEGFLDKMFGRIATRAGQDVAKDMARKDPTIGKKLARAAALVKDIENDMFAWHHRAPSEEEFKKYIKEYDEK